MHSHIINPTQNDMSTIQNLYEGSAENILKAYTHNREAIRLHERGFIQASKYHAKLVLYFSNELNANIFNALEMGEKLDLNSDLIIDQTIIADV